MNKYCCKEFQFDIEIDKTIFDYEPNIRRYSILLHKSTYASFQSFYHCFYCGKKLPKDFRKEWTKATEHLNLDDLWGKEWWDKIPKKYQTEEWWREKGLDKLFAGDEVWIDPEYAPRPSDKYCCNTIEGSIYVKKKEIIAYEGYLREYFFICYESKHQRYRKISYCGFCSKKLPKNLKKEWKFLLKKEFGIKDIVKEWGKISEEFKTEEWWRKRDLEKISKEIKENSNEDIFFPLYRIGADSLLPTDKKLAIDICNSLIEEEFSAQDIVDIIQHFYIFILIVLSFKSWNDDISGYLLNKIDCEILGVIEPEKYKEATEALVEKHRQDIRKLARRLLKKIISDDKEFKKHLKEKGFSDLDIAREEQRKESAQKALNTHYGRYITSCIVATFFNQYPRIGENKLKMILDGRIIRTKKELNEMYEKDLL